MSDAAGGDPRLVEAPTDLEAGEDARRKRRRMLLLVLLLLLLLCVIVTFVDAWLERAPGEREFIARNVECLQCHEELIPELGRRTVHDPFLKEQCTSCHTPHGEEVTERVYEGGSKRWERTSFVLEWLPFRWALDAWDSVAGVTDADEGGALISETTVEAKGEDSVLVAPTDELCWTCHGDLASSKSGLMHQHPPFDKGQCTSCHMPHASDHRTLLTDDERELCVACHPVWDEMAMSQKHPPFEGRFCTNCHDPHASEWTGILVLRQRELCFTCHPTVAYLSGKAVQHHPFYYDNCTGCHEPHASEAVPLLIRYQPELCYDCHAGIRYDFLKPSHHPVGIADFTCADCHDPHAADYTFLLTAKDNEMCFACHEGAIRATYDSSAHWNTLCIGCHTPHGSDYAPILRQWNPELCYRCHPDTRNANEEYPANHPHRPDLFFDVLAEEPLTCSTSCHDPHGSSYFYMMRYPYGNGGYGRDYVCMRCHTGVGVDF